MIRRPARAITVSALLLAACSDSGVEPGDSSSGLEVSAVRDALAIAPAGQDPAVRCDFTVRVSVADGAVDPVRIRRLVLHFYAGADRDVPFDSVSMVDVVSVFGTGQLEDDEEAVTSGWFELSVPFEVGGVVHWGDGAGDQGTSDFRIDCGPPLDEIVAAAPPVIGAVSVSHVAGDVEAGTPIDVEFSASAAGGLWETWLLITNDAHTDTIRFYEAMAEQASHVVTITFPADAELGSRLSVRAIAWDAALRGTASAPILSGTLVDTVAPQATMGFRQAANCHIESCEIPPCTPATCNFHQGFTPHLTVWAKDASGLGVATLRFNDLPPVSMPLPGLFNSQAITLPAGLTGVVELTGTVEDIYGNTVEIDLGSATIHAS